MDAETLTILVIVIAVIVLGGLLMLWIVAQAFALSTSAAVDAATGAGRAAAEPPEGKE